MVQESRFYGLPLLDVNPFSTRPLEAGDAGKLIGRIEEFGLLRTYLKLGTARRIMLTGPLGSGRTSLVRCLKPYAGAFISIDHLPAQAPAQAMLEMCYQQLIGGETLPERTELVNRLVTEMYAYSDKLPLVVIDVPASDFSVVDVALRDAHSSLERLNAIVVLVCDVRERNHLPATVITGFERFLLSPFTPTDVVELVEQRLREIGVVNSNFTLQDAETLLEGCSGYPAEVLAVLRDAVDKIRIQHAEGVAPPHFDTSARLQPRDEPQQRGGIWNQERKEVPSQAHLNEHPRTVDERMGGPTTKDSDDIIDASMPWNQRDETAAASEVAGSVDEEEGQPLEPTRPGFDLDIDRLERSLTGDNPLKPDDFASDIIDASNHSTRTPVRSGTFGSLVGRNKVSLSATESIKEDARNRPVRLEDYSEAAEWWVEESSMAEPEEALVEEGDSAALIHDEVGLPAPETDVFPYAGETVRDDEVNGEALPATPRAALDVPVDLSGSPLSPVDGTVLNALLQLLTGKNKVASDNDVQHLVDFFSSRRAERLGAKESYALDKIALGSLSIAETYVVGVSNQRAFSPSDAEILQHLDIKRSRLSQISNRLLKHGILQVRPSGRTRKYVLTQAARAQLLAWGALKGGEA